RAPAPPQWKITELQLGTSAGSTPGGNSSTIEPPPVIFGFHKEEAPSAGTPPGITCSRQPNTRSGSMCPTVWRAATGNRRGTLSTQASGALTVTVESEPALLGTSGATRHFTPNAV